MCMLVRSRWESHSPRLWQPTALQSLGRCGRAPLSPGPSLQLWYDMWGWSQGRHLSPTHVQKIRSRERLPCEFYGLVEFFMFTTRTRFSMCWSDKVTGMFSLGLRWLYVLYFWNAYRRKIYIPSSHFFISPSETVLICSWFCFNSSVHLPMSSNKRHFTFKIKFRINWFCHCKEEAG